MTDARRYLVVANPTARRGADAVIDRLRSLARPGSTFDVAFTRGDRQRPGELSERAVNADMLLAIGGDGTVAEAVTAAAGVDIPLGIIPAGSTNIIARNLGTASTVEQAARMVTGDHALKRIDIGKCNGRRFLHMGGAGFDSRMFAMTSRALKRRIGWVAYIQGASRTILAPPVTFEVVVDGTLIECESPLVLVANGASIIAPSISIHPDIRYDDGLLDVVIITANRATEIARTVGNLALRHLDRSPYTVHLQGQEIEIRSNPSIPVQLDGDIVGETPATFSIVPNAIDIVIPR